MVCLWEAQPAGYTWHRALQQRPCHGEGCGQVATLSHSSLTNDQQHKDDNENYKEGVAVYHHQLHQAGLENLLPSVKTKTLKKQTHLGLGASGTESVLYSSPMADYPEKTQPQWPRVLNLGQLFNSAKEKKKKKSLSTYIKF